MTVSGHIFKMFGRSPIRPLQEHMAKVYACAEALKPFVEAVLQNNWEKAEQQQKLISNYEHQADEIKKDIRTHLPKGLFLPVPRGDLLEILRMQDKIANKAKDIAGLVIGRQMEIPQAIANSYNTFLDRCLDAVTVANQAASELDQLVETGFRGAEVDILERMIETLREIEHVTDEIQIDVRKELFNIEKKLSPIDVIFLYTMINWTGEIADHAEQVGNRLELLLAH